MEKYRKFTTRIKDLIREFEEEIYPKRKTIELYLGGVRYEYPAEINDKLSSWLIRVENILVLIFKEESIQHRRFVTIRKKEEITADVRLDQIKGLLVGCLDDLEKGFLEGQEFIIANEVFDSVLGEAEFFLKEQNNKDISAILLRIVLGDSLKRMARKEGVEILDTNGKDKKFSVLNDELKGKDVYNQTTWRLIQAWLDIGNAASKGKFEEYTFEQVEGFYEGVNTFMANYFN
jgi:hypothetical protein